ncbi:MAG: baseplate J/gp47 family protein [Pseudomonadota bacterium]|nr:baseplate J/gp47 family protein [Pseudomonadota bacterium]
MSVPAYPDILADLLAQYRNIYGTNVYLGTDSADYQWISVIAAKVADTMQAVQLAYNARSPLTAIGSALDSIVKLNGIARKTASFSTCPLTITGTPNAVIANGVAKDVNGYLWSLPASATVGAGGSVIVTATCQTPGNVNASIGQITLIATPAAGWVAVTNAAAAVPGLPVESDAVLRGRQSLSVALPSRTLLAGTVAAIAATAGVTRYNVLENPTNAADTYGNPAHSITCIIEGGANADIAQAIYNNRGIGCFTNGTTSVTVTDAYTGSSLAIAFSRPAYVPVYVSLSIHALTGYTTATTAAIQAAITSYLNSLQIGQLVVLSELYGAALTVRPNPDAPVFSIRALTLGTAASPSGTADVAIAFNQVAQGTAANVVLTQV